MMDIPVVTKVAVVECYGHSFDFDVTRVTKFFWDGVLVRAVSCMTFSCIIG